VSVKAINWAFRQVLSDKCSLVLISIAWSINDKLGCAWVAQAKLAAKTNNISLSTLKRALKDLETLDLIKISKAWKGGHQHNVYQVNMYQSVRWTGDLPWREFVRQKERERKAKAPKPDENFGAYARRMASSAAAS
jgi:hypothetical protein